MVMAERKVYSEEQKKEIVQLARETSVSNASKQTGASRLAIANWMKGEDTKEVKEKVKSSGRKAKAAAKEAGKKVEDTIVAETVEAKKTTRAMGRKAKAAVEGASEKVGAKAKSDSRKVKAAAKEAEKKVEDTVVAETVEAKKTTRAMGRKAKEAVSDAGAKVKAATAKKPRAIKTSYILQSAFGHELVVDEIQAKIPDNVEKVYIRIDQNMLHYVLKDGSTGSVRIWE